MTAAWPEQKAFRPINVPWPLRNWLDRVTAAALNAGPPLDLSRPAGEQALVPPDSMSWVIFKNPVAMFIGGVSAVLLELAEPRVRAGVWDHTSFRTDPVRRLRRTGAAAMVTVYGARSQAEAMIAGVRRRHGAVIGKTPEGTTYEANDPQLLKWVQATAAFGFLAAYDAFVRPVSREDQDRYFAEGVEGSKLYGAQGVPTSRAALDVYFKAMRPQLGPSPVIFEFLDIISNAPVMPAPLRPLQRMMVRAAVEILPPWAQRQLDVATWRLRPFEARLLRGIGVLADRITIANGPAAQACKRLGLPADYLYR